LVTLSPVPKAEFLADRQELAQLAGVVLHAATAASVVTV
jgi:hypothetical protein